MIAISRRLHILQIRCQNRFEQRETVIASAALVSVDWAHRGFWQMITVVMGIHSMPVMRIV
jgi:hypothetical protein